MDHRCIFVVLLTGCVSSPRGDTRVLPASGNGPVKTYADYKNVLAKLFFDAWDTSVLPEKSDSAPGVLTEIV